MVTLTKLEQYKDDRGNEIIFDGCIEKGVSITFIGSNNKLFVKSGASVTELIIRFDCDSAYCEIGKGAFKANMRIGQDSKVVVGDGVTCSNRCYISAAEGASVTIGHDCMLSIGIIIRTDDSHPIFDVQTGERVNVSKSVAIGQHVWLGEQSKIFGGAKIGNGSVIGFGSLVKRKIPNNCVAAGFPAKVVRKNIAWERPHLTADKPYYKLESSTVKKSKYWNKTVEDAPKRTTLIDKIQRIALKFMPRKFR